MGHQTFISSQTKNIICGTGIGKNTLSADNLQKDLKNSKKLKQPTESYHD